MSFEHDWNLSAGEAISLQKRLARYVRREDDFEPVGYVAGVDVGFEEGNRVARAAIAVLSFPQLALEEKQIARLRVSFPYIPGLLSFREGPVILEAFGKLRRQPNLLLFDGQGIAHPRRLGIASHIGLLVDRPAIGVAKSRLAGKTRADLGQEKGEWVDLIDGEEIIGAALRTRSAVKPVYVSIGHRISLPTAIDYVLACTTRYKLPETTRWAHRLASG